MIYSSKNKTSFDNKHEQDGLFSNNYRNQNKGNYDQNLNTEQINQPSSPTFNQKHYEISDIDKVSIQISEDISDPRLSYSNKGIESNMEKMGDSRKGGQRQKITFMQQKKSEDFNRNTPENGRRSTLKSYNTIDTISTIPMGSDIRILSKSTVITHLYKQPRQESLHRSNNLGRSHHYSDNGLESVISYRHSHAYMQRQLLVDGSVAYIIRRHRGGLSDKLWPTYDMHYFLDNQYFLTGKLTGNNTMMTYCLTHSKEDFQENGQFYSGKVKCNFSGSLSNIYGPGNSIASGKEPLRQLMATVQYKTNFFGKARPRDFKVYILQRGVSYYDLEGASRTQEIPLSKLSQFEENRDKILVLRNRQPVWSEKVNGYEVNFAGRIKIPSVKNFLLQAVDNPQMCYLLFGKLNQSEFRLDVGEPISPNVAFGIALSQFGRKYGLEGYC